MTMKRGRGRPRKVESVKTPSEPRFVMITGKRVQGDNGNKHNRDSILEIGVDVCVETAARMVEGGVAIISDGQTIDELERRKSEAAAIRAIKNQKSAAEWNMQQYDRQEQATRDQWKENNGQVADSILDDNHGQASTS